MTLTPINPPTLATPETYSQVVVATGPKLVFVAGQVAEDAEGAPVGDDDLGAQARRAFANLGHALEAAGARPDHVAKITIYVANLQLEDLPAIEAARVALFGGHKPADALIGVQTLAYPAPIRIEVEAVAVVGEP